MAEEKKIHPYTEEELNKMGEKLKRALKPLYPWIIDIHFGYEPDEKYKNNWHLITVKDDYGIRKEMIRKSHPEYFDEYGWVKDDGAYEIFSVQRSEFINKLKTLLKFMGYKTRGLDFDPHVSM
jgi:hypothetical protein